MVVSTTLPDYVVGLTSCYLSESRGDVAVSHLHLGPGPDERLAQRILSAGQPGLTHARACLLDHVAELQAALTEITSDGVTIDIGPQALERAADAWTQSD